MKAVVKRVAPLKHDILATRRIVAKIAQRIQSGCEEDIVYED